MAVKPTEFEKLPIYKPDYEHTRCRCGGIIRTYDRENFTCEICGKGYEPYRLDYDYLKINDKTGWIFPVIMRRDK